MVFLGGKRMKNRILNYMKEFGSITTLDAFIDLGCSRLSEYIRQLRQEYQVEDKWESGTNRWGEKTEFKRYWLKSEK